MKNLLISMLLIFCIAGCVTSNSNHHAEIVNTEVSRLPLPSKPFSSYSNFQIKNLLLDNQTLQKDDKITVAKELDSKLQARLLPLLNEWNNNKMNTGTGTLIITPKLQSLHVVSPGARFWVGGMAGDSRIDMDLIIIDAQTGNEVAKPRINKAASAMGGGWSVGATDKNLLNYITDISYQYLENNYNWSD